MPRINAAPATARTGRNTFRVHLLSKPPARSLTTGESRVHARAVGAEAAEVVEPPLGWEDADSVLAHVQRNFRGGRPEHPRYERQADIVLTPPPQKWPPRDMYGTAPGAEHWEILEAGRAAFAPEWPAAREEWAVAREQGTGSRQAHQMLRDPGPCVSDLHAGAQERIMQGFELHDWTNPCTGMFSHMESELQMPLAFNSTRAAALREQKWHHIGVELAAGGDAARSSMSLLERFRAATAEGQVALAGRLAVCCFEMKKADAVEVAVRLGQLANALAHDATTAVPVHDAALEVVGSVVSRVDDCDSPELLVGAMEAMLALGAGLPHQADVLLMRLQVRLLREPSALTPSLSVRVARFVLWACRALPRQGERLRLSPGSRTLLGLVRESLLRGHFSVPSPAADIAAEFEALAAAD